MTLPDFGNINAAPSIPTAPPLTTNIPQAPPLGLNVPMAPALNAAPNSDLGLQSISPKQLEHPRQPRDKREVKLIFQRAMSKLATVRQGSFPTSRPLSDSYWKERLDPLHRPNTELQELFAKFTQDKSYHGSDFYQWLKDKEPKLVPKSQVSYLTADQRIPYLITFKGNSIVFSTEAIDVGVVQGKKEIIFVLDGKYNFYFGEKSTGRFHHSSMLGGAPVAGAGTMKICGTVIEEVNNHSGHYKPGLKEMQTVAKSMELRGADIGKIVMKVFGKAAEPEWQGTALEILGNTPAKKPELQAKPEYKKSGTH